MQIVDLHLENIGFKEIYVYIYMGNIKKTSAIEETKDL